MVEAEVVRRRLVVEEVRWEVVGAVVVRMRYLVAVVRSL